MDRSYDALAASWCYLSAVKLVCRSAFGAKVLAFPALLNSAEGRRLLMPTCSQQAYLSLTNAE